MSTKEIRANRKRDTTRPVQIPLGLRTQESKDALKAALPRLSGAGSDLELKQSPIPAGVLVVLSYPD